MTRGRTGLLCAALMAAPLAPLATLTPAFAAQARTQGVDLDEPVHGGEAVRELGADLDEAAALNGMSEDQLRDLLLSDRTAWVDGSGKVFYVEPAATADESAAGSAAPTAIDPSAAFTLHSKPGSQHVIFLDFDGHLVSGTAWNDGGVAAATHPAWSLDGDPATFSTTERNAISSIWARVAEDYAPFDVDVTTADPGAAAIGRTSGSDPTYGTRVLISPSAQAASKICPQGCGGVAYYDVFDAAGSTHDYYQPAWVFPQALGNSTKSIAEAASHEAGHNFGLDHDGVGQQPYYQGHAMWAPIMGVGYGRPVVQWSKGEYSSPTTRQDDVAIIAANGAPYRPDEAGNTVAAAAPISAATSYITTRSDVDVWSLGTCGGAVSFAAGPAATSPDLDIELRVVDASGATVAIANPTSAASNADVATGMGASISTSLPAAGYFLRVDGVGNGSGTSGYTDYGSIGAYTLSAAGCGLATSAPGAPTGLTVVTGSDGRSATLRWAPAPDGGSPLTGYQVQRDGEPAQALGASAVSHTFSGLTPGSTYTVSVAAANAVGPGAAATMSFAVRVPTATAPPAPRIGAVTGGRKGGVSNATVSWTPPASTGGKPVTSYVVHAYRIKNGRTVATVLSDGLSPSARRLKMRLPKGRYQFAIQASNAVGWSALSARSATVRAR